MSQLGQLWPRSLRNAPPGSRDPGPSSKPSCQHLVTSFCMRAISCWRRDHRAFGRDGGLQKDPPRPGIRRRRRNRRDHFRAQMGSSLQGGLGLGWRTGRIQLASGFNGDRFHSFARNGWVERERSNVVSKHRLKSSRTIKVGLLRVGVEVSLSPA